MALNSSHHDSGGLVVFLGENILCYHDGVEMEFSKTNNEIMSKGTKKGRAYLTTHRVIFVSKGNDAMKSFAMGFLSMKNVELEQPIFGANYLKGIVVAEPAGKWTDQAEFKMRFNKGGCIEFGQAMLQAASLTSRFAGPQFAPPPYSYENQTVHPASPQMYVPPPGQYGWIPQGDVFYPPPQYGVFYADAPPPYPGVSGAPAAPAGAMAPNGVPNGHYAPVGAQQAYYDPSNPSVVYAPPAYSAVPPSAPPPPDYESSVGKKQN